MDKSIKIIFTLFLIIISSSIAYRFLFYQPAPKEKITLNEPFTIEKNTIYAVKNDKNITFKITDMKATLTGYIFDYELKIKNKIYTKDTIKDSPYEVSVISTDYKTKAKVVILKKEG